MSDNPQYGPQHPVALTRIRVIGLSGGDAIAFAQAQFMNDVTRLGDGEWQWNGWLDPKGRVQALFLLLRIDAGTLWLVAPFDADALVAALRRFVFRSKVKIAAVDMHASGRFARSAHATGARSARVGDDIELDLSGDGGARTLVLSPRPIATSGDDDTTWWAVDLLHGWPTLPGVALDAWTPQQLSLERLNAFSVKKGCYPGQEIVARTHFLGRAKRGLARIRGDAPVPRSALQDADGRDVGQIVGAIGGDALAVVPLDYTGALMLDGSAVERLPLAGGLER